MFRRLLCNLYHWGLIIGWYNGRSLSDKYIAVNWGLNGLQIETGISFEEACKTIKQYGNKDKEYFKEQRESLPQYYIDPSGDSFDFQDLYKVSSPDLNFVLKDYKS